MTVRTRLAPSPTSSNHSLHVGNVRTGLFAYLYAKKHGGVFYLRIEDSDVARNVDGCAKGMLDDLHWLGLSPDEGWGTDNQPRGPYTQSERAGAYKEAINYLLEKGYAYKCVCTPEFMDQQRAAAKEKDPKNPWKYPGTCRNLKTDPDTNYVVRFKTDTTGETVVDDLVYGKVVFPHKENFDWVIARGNGNAMYNLAVVLDDIHHGTTTCIRGADHLLNTPMQMEIYKAMGANIPTFAHLPMVNGSDGKKMSKRDSSGMPTNVKDFRALGYSPGALINYIARLSWAHGNKEIFSKGELIELFGLDACGKSAGRFDPAKLMATQYAHMKSETLLSDQEYINGVMPFLGKRELDNPGLGAVEEVRDRLKSMLGLVRQRTKTFVEAAAELDPVLRKSITIDKDAEERFLTVDNKNNLHNLGEFLRTVDDWTELSLRNSMNEWLGRVNFTMKEVSQSIRVSLLGKTIGPELFQTIVAIGKERTIERLSR
jgi:glutamyl-tRNA synthetase